MSTAVRAITAKVTVTGREPAGGDLDPQIVLTFLPDYRDGRNKEWAYYTPSLQLRMQVRGDVADQFPLGRHFALTFTPEDSPAPAA